LTPSISDTTLIIFFYSEGIATKIVLLFEELRDVDHRVWSAFCYTDGSDEPGHNNNDRGSKVIAKTARMLYCLRYTIYILNLYWPADVRNQCYREF